jgi:hypothetical protein
MTIDRSTPEGVTDMAASTRRVIRRNATRQHAAIRKQVTKAVVRDLYHNFEATDVDPARAFEDYARYRNAELVELSDGTWKVRLHSNCWYELSA